MAADETAPDDDALLAEVLAVARQFPEALPFSELPGLLATGTPATVQPERDRSAPRIQASGGVPASPSEVR
jgi:hypothetical protein